MNAHSDHQFAFYQGFYERLAEGPDTGRTHETDQAWNEAYDRGRNEAEAVVGDRSFHFERIDWRFDESGYLKAQDMIINAGGLFGDGQGGDLGTNPEYERGIAEMVCTACRIPLELKDQVVDEIHSYAITLRPED